MMERRAFVAGSVGLLAAPLAAKGHRYVEGRRPTGRLVLLP
jgi:hypothetical protein